MVAFAAGLVVGMILGVVFVVGWAVLAVAADAEREVRRWGMR